MPFAKSFNLFLLTSFFLILTPPSLFAEKSESISDLLPKLNSFVSKGQFDQAIELTENYLAKASEAKDKNYLLQQLYQKRGETHFIASRIPQSVDDFEKVITLNPSRKAHHWQLGLSYYYQKEFLKGSQLFELHKTVNPNDVENAVWHFICNVPLVGFEQAREQLIPIKGDSRVPMMDIYELFAGRMKLETFLNKVPEYQKVDSPRTTSMMYTHQYLGLFFEAKGDSELAKQHTLKAYQFYKSYQRTHYMGDTVKTHLVVRDWLAPTKKALP